MDYCIEKKHEWVYCILLVYMMCLSLDSVHPQWIPLPNLYINHN